MVAEYTYCPVEVKQILKSKIILCKWSPKTDLIALGASDGSVSVHRYKMACIWDCLPPDQSDVTCLVWRPDGNCLAASYSSGSVHIYLANDGFVFHKVQLDGPVSHVGWTSGFTTCEHPVTNADTYFPDMGSLASFQSDANFTSGNLFKLTQLFSNVDKTFTILTIYAADVLHVYGCESFQIARITISSFHTTGSFELIGCQFSSCMRHLLLLLKGIDESGHHFLELQKIPCQGLVEFAAQLRNLAIHHSSIRLCKTILDTSFDQLCSSWEDMILELDSKFTNYARDCLSRNKEWSLCAELLEFILFGHCPSTLRKFLVEDWTAHSLKRTGTATLKTYESIKIICFQQLQFILQRMLLHASELLGNLRDTQRFAPFGITEHKAVQLCAAVGSILQKTQELHLIIEKSIIHLRAFFKWIYVAILGLSGRILPDDFPRVTPPERELVIEFITKYLKPVIIQGELQSFHIDLVQQYIRSGEVQIPLEAVADQSLPGNEDRSKLRVLVNFSDEQLSSGNFPAGLFPYCPKATLADLVKTLSDRVQSLFGPPGPGDFSRSCFAINKLVSQVLVRTNAASTNILTAIHCQPTLIESNTNLHLKTLDTCPEKKTLLAWSCSMRESEPKLMIAELTSRQPDTALSIIRTVCVAIDTLPSVSDHNNGSFELLGLEFFTSGSLLLLVSRPSSSTDPSISSGSFKDNNPSWFVMLQIQEVLSASNHAFYNCDSGFPDPLYSFIDKSLRIVCPARLSNCITPDHVEPLPQNAIRFTSNGERSIVFVLFKTTTPCRVYLLERPDAEESSNATDAVKPKEMEKYT